MKILFLYGSGGHNEVAGLRQSGHEVEFVSTAQWAYKKLSEEEYKVVIIHGSDDMPVKDKRTLSKVIRDEFPRTMRICYTGEVPQLYLDQFMERFDGVISKWGGWKGLQEIIETVQK